MKRWIIRAKFEPRDLWVGLFWDRDYDGLHLYVRLLPTLVIHAAHVRACRECGCTDEDGCITGWGTCSWLEPGLCSECAGYGLGA